MEDKIGCLEARLDARGDEINEEQSTNWPRKKRGVREELDRLHARLLELATVKAKLAAWARRRKKMDPAEET